MAWPPFSKSVIALIAILFALWFGSVMVPPLGDFKASFLVLDTQKILSEFQVWTLFTHAWFEPSFFAVLFAALAVWLFGSEIEQREGTRHMWTIIGVAVVVSGVVVALLELLLGGTYSGFSGPLMALVAAYCWRSWNTPLNFFFVPITGKVLLLALLGLNLVMAAIGAGWLHMASQLTGAGVGILMARKMGGIREMRTRFRYWQARRKLKIVRSPEDEPNGKSNGIDRKYMN